MSTEAKIFETGKNNQGSLDSVLAGSMDFSQWNDYQFLDKREPDPMNVPSYIDPALRHLVKSQPR